MGIEQEIEDWAATRPAWQQSVLFQLAKRHAYSQSEVAALAAALTAGKQPGATALSAADVPGAQPAGATVLLRSIRDATNVNALLDGQELTFGTAGLTVVYGDNASGKSGYARLIKNAVGARHQEPVHANVFADAATQPQNAAIAFTSVGTEKVCNWPQTDAGDLHAVSFYDEACGDTYIGGDSELTYRPPSLAILDGLIAVCDAVRGVLDEDLRSNQLARHSLPAAASGTAASVFMAQLSGATTPAEIDAICAVPPDANDQLGQLLQEEARLRASDPSKERTRLHTLAKNVDVVSKHIGTVADALSDAKIGAASAARRKAGELRAAATIASAATFESEPLQGVGSETWRTLWEGARGFSTIEAYTGADFPVTTDGAHCPLCQQQLSPDAVARFHRFHSFMEDTTAQQATAAEQAAERATAGYRSLDTTPLQVASSLESLQSVDSALATTVTSWLQSAEARRSEVVSALESRTDTSNPALGPSPRSALEQLVTELRSQAASIDRTRFDASLAQTVRRKDDLQSRLAVGSQRSEVEAEI